MGGRHLVVLKWGRVVVIVDELIAPVDHGMARRNVMSSPRPRRKVAKTMPAA
jgi:hypothetical protein